MTCAAPEGTPPRRFNYLKTPPLASQDSVTDASRTFTIFHGRMRSIPVHPVSNQQKMVKSRIFF